MEVEKLKVTELKAALAEKGLDTKGNKAALVERLQGVLNQTDDNNDNSNDKVENSKEDRNGEDIINPEEEEKEEQEEEEEPAVPGNEDGTTFDQQEFVRSKPAGISFGLHEPTKVKPQPKELAAPAEAAVAACRAGEANNSRATAAAFFNGQEGGAEAAVPLPPSTSFMEESEDEEEEAPPGVGDVELPVAIFNQVRAGLQLVTSSHCLYVKEAVPVKEGDKSITWRRFTAQVSPVPESDWRPGKHLQSPALFLSEEAEMAVSLNCEQHNVLTLCRRERSWCTRWRTTTSRASVRPRSRCS